MLLSVYTGHPVPSSNEYRPNPKYNGSQFKGKGVEYTFGDYHWKPTPDGPGPGDHDVIFDTSGEPGKTFGMKTHHKSNNRNNLLCLESKHIIKDVSKVKDRKRNSKSFLQEVKKRAQDLQNTL